MAKGSSPVPPQKNGLHKKKQAERTSFLSRLIHPKLTLRLVLIVIYFLLYGLSNLFSLYEAIAEQQELATFWVSLCSALLYLPASVGIAQLLPWGRKLSLVISALAIIIAVPILFFFGAYLDAGLTLLLNAMIFRYLLSPECRLLFAR
nr:hypothetical protein [uncultured Anaeromusa sp.]